MARYPWEPYELLLRARLGISEHATGNLVEQATSGEMGRFVGVTGDQIRRWRRGCGLDRYQADHLAVRLSLMPYEVWPEWLDDAIADYPPPRGPERKCRAEDCDVMFSRRPNHHRQEFCTKGCQMRAARVRKAA